MASLAERVEKLERDFESFDGWEDRYKHIIQLGKSLPPLPEEYRVETNKVKGCQSQVWLHADENDALIVFQADSDASIVKGVIAVLFEVYNRATPEEILATKPDFLDSIGLRQHLSMSRANGLAAMVKQIHMYAMAFQAKRNMQQIKGENS